MRIVPQGKDLAPPQDEELGGKDINSEVYSSEYIPTPDGVAMLSWVSTSEKIQPFSAIPHNNLKPCVGI